MNRISFLTLSPISLCINLCVSYELHFRKYAFICGRVRNNLFCCVECLHVLRWVVCFKSCIYFLWIVWAYGSLLGPNFIKFWPFQKNFTFENFTTSYVECGCSYTNLNLSFDQYQWLEKCSPLNKHELRLQREWMKLHRQYVNSLHLVVR